MGQNAGRVPAQAEIGRMPETDHAAQAQRKVQPNTCQRQDGRAGRQGYEKWLPGCVRYDGQDQQQADQGQVDPTLAVKSRH